MLVILERVLDNQYLSLYVHLPMEESRERGGCRVQVCNICGKVEL
jgi:hypothetical protein